LIAGGYDHVLQGPEFVVTPLVASRLCKQIALNKNKTHIMRAI